MATRIRKAGDDLQVAIENWLLRSGIRIPAGRHAGAIAGWLDERGEPEFAYPEITGYYLSWLAFVHARRGVDVSCHAAAAVQWAAGVTTAGRPPETRYYFDGRRDWHNDATFTFDLAMLCRGLHAVRGLVPEKPRRDTLEMLLRHILKANEDLRVFTEVRGSLPDRWSTRPGPFQLKTAAALLQIRSHPALWRLFHAWSGRVRDGIDTADLHAAFYALEGLVQFGVAGARAEAIREAAESFEAIAGAIDGARSDVVAQALRLAAALRSLGYLQGMRWEDRLRDLHLRLEGFVADSGAVLFRPRGLAPLHSNTWSAIFAHQYLCRVAGGS